MEVTIEQVRKAMKATTGPGEVTCWYSVPEIDGALRAGEAKGWLCRMSTTQVSSASIYDRMDAGSWPRVLEALKGGATIYRPPGLKGYYTNCADDRDRNHGMGISAKLVKKLEAKGILIRAGVDRYALGELPEEKAPEAAAAATTTKEHQMDLFH